MPKKNGKEIPLVIRDTKDIKNIFVQVNVKKGTSTVYSNFSAWENLAYLMEALGATVQQCIHEGIGRKKVHSAVQEYLSKVLKAYTPKAPPSTKN
jgi:hypothetical protein